MSFSPTPASVCGVLVVHCPGPGLEQALRATAPQVARLVVVDNTPAELAKDTGPWLDGLLGELGGERLGLGRNVGQAAGLNIGFRRAWELGAAHVLTLDQDSLPQPNMVQRLAAIWTEVAAQGPVAVLGSNYQAMVDGQCKVGFPGAEGRAFKNPVAITAGSLVSLAAWEAVGQFREEFFIDHVDHDFCLRARRLGWRVWIAADCLLTHAIGAITYHQLWGKRLETSNHTAARRYFWWRNGVVLVGDFLTSDPRWCLTLVGFHFWTNLTNMLLFEQDRGVKLRWVLRGVWDGLRRDFRRNPLAGHPGGRQGP